MQVLRLFLMAATLILSAHRAAIAEEQPVPPVYVGPQFGEGGETSSEPPAFHCEGQNCLQQEQENPAQECEGQDCDPIPLEQDGPLIEKVN